MIQQSSTNNFEITFFLPTHVGAKDIGGAQKLFISIAEYIANNYPIHVNFIDFKNGSVFNHIKSDKVNLIELNPREKIYLADHHIIIAPYWRLKYLIEIISFKKQHRIFLWNIGTDCHINNFALLGYYKKIPFNFRKKFINIFEHSTKIKLETLMNYLLAQGAVAYMCGKNWSIVNEYLTINHHTPFYLPVVIDTDHVRMEANCDKKFNDSKILNIGWLGRFGKMNTILAIINEISKIKMSIVFHIIGWGNNFEKSKISDYANSKKVKFKLIEGLYDEKLNRYIIENIDLGIAMGLSLQNFSSLRIPTIATQFFDDNQLKLIHKIKFKWFFQLENYDLATSIGVNVVQNDLHPLEYFTSNVCKNYMYYSNECFQAFKTNFEFKNMLDKLISHILSDNLKPLEFNAVRDSFQDNIFHKLKIILRRSK